MSKRNGDVQVIDYIVSCFLDPSSFWADLGFCSFQRRGWEPDAVLNWLALAGWGARHEPHADLSSSAADTTTQSTHAGAHAPKPVQLQSAPDSTHIMTKQELISEFDLSAVTQRSSSLDATKLEYINKHHLMLRRENDEELKKMAERVHDSIKAKFPTSQYTSVDRIKQGIWLLDVSLAVPS